MIVSSGTKGFYFKEFEAKSIPPFDMLFDIFKELITHTAGDFDEAISWLRELDKEYELTDENYTIDDFIAERTEYTAGRALDVAALNALKSDFLRLVETSADGAHHQLTTPDGRPLLIHFERTVSIDPMKASFHAISYSSQPDHLVTRAYLQPVDVNVKVMCRDVSYAFPGQERGRFAACEGANGTWTMARASATLGTPI